MERFSSPTFEVSCPSEPASPRTVSALEASERIYATDDVVIALDDTDDAHQGALPCWCGAHVKEDGVTCAVDGCASRAHRACVNRRWICPMCVAQRTLLHARVDGALCAIRLGATLGDTWTRVDAVTSKTRVHTHHAEITETCTVVVSGDACVTSKSAGPRRSTLAYRFNDEEWTEGHCFRALGAPPITSVDIHLRPRRLRKGKAMWLLVLSVSRVSADEWSRAGAAYSKLLCGCVVDTTAYVAAEFAAYADFIARLERGAVTEWAWTCRQCRVTTPPALLRPLIGTAPFQWPVGRVCAT